MFTPLHSNTNQELLEKYICNQSSHYENYDGAVVKPLKNALDVAKLLYMKVRPTLYMLQLKNLNL